MVVHAAEAGVARSVSRPVVEVEVVASLREIVTTSMLVGRRVRVSGHCAPRARTDVLSPSPHLQGAWLLEADGVLVFVTGPEPRGCTATGKIIALTITAIVAEDTLPPILDLPGAPRRYLVRVDHEPE